MSENGGSFTPFLEYTPNTSATFTGEFGHTYSFYSVATDYVGHREAIPSAGQASTTLRPKGPGIGQDPQLITARRGAMGIVLAFAAALDELTAESIANYRVASKPGRDKIWGTADDKLVALNAPVYDATSQAVTLSWKKPIKKRFHVTVDASDGVRGANGQEIDGDGDGQPGGDYMRLIVVTRSAIGAATSGRLDATVLDGALNPLENQSAVTSVLDDNSTDRTLLGIATHAKHRANDVAPADMNSRLTLPSPKGKAEELPVSWDSLAASVIDHLLQVF